MKGIVVVTILLAGLPLLNSCKKEYNCHCVEVLTAGAGGTSEYLEVVKARNRDKAEEACKSLNDLSKTCEYFNKK